MQMFKNMHSLIICYFFFAEEEEKGMLDPVILLNKGDDFGDRILLLTKDVAGQLLKRWFDKETNDAQKEELQKALDEDTIEDVELRKDAELAMDRFTLDLVQQFKLRLVSIRDAPLHNAHDRWYVAYNERETALHMFILYEWWMGRPKRLEVKTMAVAFQGVHQVLDEGYGSGSGRMRPPMVDLFKASLCWLQGRHTKLEKIRIQVLSRGSETVVLKTFGLAELPQPEKDMKKILIPPDLCQVCIDSLATLTFEQKRGVFCSERCAEIQWFLWSMP
jgi:hypothetical protein